MANDRQNRVRESFRKMTRKAAKGVKSKRPEGHPDHGRKTNVGDPGNSK